MKIGSEKGKGKKVIKYLEYMVP